MRNLHGITIGTVEGWFWMTLSGQNGRDIDHGRAHLFRLERGTPPPIGDNGDTWRRSAWHPFRMQNMHIWNAMCHNIKTASRQPRFAHWYNQNNLCPNCQQLAANMGITGLNHTAVVNADPWELIPGRRHWDTVTYNPNWMRQADPVSGL